MWPGGARLVSHLQHAAREQRQHGGAHSAAEVYGMEGTGMREVGEVSPTGLRAQPRALILALVLVLRSRGFATKGVSGDGQWEHVHVEGPSLPATSSCVAVAAGSVDGTTGGGHVLLHIRGDLDGGQVALPALDLALLLLRLSLLGHQCGHVSTGVRVEHHHEGQVRKPLPCLAIIKQIQVLGGVHVGAVLHRDEIGARHVRVVQQRQDTLRV
mmetsp:Transcript_6740/g.11085  ORF Transcript_6740/g.11085 Transcript_6740/m.11085 type:complete len:213 (-) Transcript_6740:115-753(-)